MTTNLFKAAATVFCTVVLTLLVFVGEASAQRPVGCFYQGRQVADSLCTSGGSSGYSGGYGGGLFYALGGAIMQALIGAFTPDPNEGVAQRRQSVMLNNEGVELSINRRRQEAIAKYRAAVAIDPHNAVAHANYFMERAQLDADHGRLTDALHEARKAVRVSTANDEARRITLEAAQRSVSFLEQALGEKVSQQRRDFADQNRDTLGQMRSIGSGAPSTGDLQVEAKRGAFGTMEMKPTGLAGDKGPPPQDIKGAVNQLSSAKASGTAAASAGSDEAAKKLGDCMFGAPGCAKGEPVKMPTLSGGQSGYTDTTSKMLSGIPERYRDRREVVGLVQQYDYFDKQVVEKRQQVAQWKADAATAKGDQAADLRNRMAAAENEIKIAIADRDDSKRQIDVQIKKFQIDMVEK